MKGWSLEDLKTSAVAHLNQHLIQPEVKKKKRAKMGAETVEWEGLFFRSKREYRRFRELLLMVKAGEITYPEREIPYELNDGGTHSYKYVLDFRYKNQRTGETIYEDCKGFKTTVYKKKKKLMKKIYGITILET